jgi:hypothetical protein
MQKATFSRSKSLKAAIFFSQRLSTNYIECAKWEVTSKTLAFHSLLMADNTFWNAIDQLIVNSHVNKFWNSMVGGFMISWPNLKTPTFKLFLNNLLFFPVYQAIRENEYAIASAHPRYADTIYPECWFNAQVHKKMHHMASLKNVTPYQVRIT